MRTSPVLPDPLLEAGDADDGGEQNEQREAHGETAERGRRVTRGALEAPLGSSDADTEVAVEAVGRRRLPGVEPDGETHGLTEAPTGLQAGHALVRGAIAAPTRGQRLDRRGRAASRLQARRDREQPAGRLELAGDDVEVSE